MTKPPFAMTPFTVPNVLGGNSLLLRGSILKILGLSRLVVFRARSRGPLVVSNLECLHRSNIFCTLCAQLRSFAHCAHVPFYLRFLKAEHCGSQIVVESCSFARPELKGPSRTKTPCRGNKTIYLHRSGPLLENGLDRPKNHCGRYGFPSFYSISISTVGVVEARVFLSKFSFLALWVVVLDISQLPAMG